MPTQIYRYKISIPSQKKIKAYWKKSKKTSLADHLSFLHSKQLLMKLLSESLQTYANLLLRLMPANPTPTRCVNPCSLVFIRVEISILKPVDSHLDKKRLVAFQIWSCLIFNVQDLIVKLGASTLQADRRKMTASVLMGFFLFHCNTVFQSKRLLLPLLSRSRAPPICRWRRYQTWR